MDSKNNWLRQNEKTPPPHWASLRVKSPTLTVALLPRWTLLKRTTNPQKATRKPRRSWQRARAAIWRNHGIPRAPAQQNNLDENSHGIWNATGSHQDGPAGQASRPAGGHKVVCLCHGTAPADARPGAGAF